MAVEVESEVVQLHLSVLPVDRSSTQGFQGYTGP